MREMNPRFSAVILVCCPLVALMQDQVKKVSAVADIDLSVAYKGKRTYALNSTSFVCGIHERIYVCEITCVLETNDARNSS